MRTFALLVKCDALSILNISFDPEPLKLGLHPVGKGLKGSKTGKLNVDGKRYIIRVSFIFSS